MGSRKNAEWSHSSDELRRLSTTITKLGEALSYPLAEISKTAERFVDVVCQSTERIMICGSIRRKRPLAKDIDIVAIPKIVSAEKPGYFAPIKTTESLLHSRIEDLVKNKTVKARVKSDGKTMVGQSVAFVEFQGIPVDLYYASEQTWWGLVQMRTGSAKLNAMLATRALGMGLKYHGDGNGITRNGVRLDDGQSEESIFRALDLRYLEPSDRN